MKKLFMSNQSLSKKRQSKSMLILSNRKYRWSVFKLTNSISSKLSKKKRKAILLKQKFWKLKLKGLRMRKALIG